MSDTIYVCRTEGCGKHCTYIPPKGRVSPRWCPVDGSRCLWRPTSGVKTCPNCEGRGVLTVKDFGGLTTCKLCYGTGVVKDLIGEDVNDIR